MGKVSSGAADRHFYPPTEAWAEGGTISGSGTQESPYLLEDAADWATFTNSSNAATYWASGVYAKMTADIGTAESPVTTMVGTSSIYYYGNFDGDGHTLTVALENTSADGLAPFMRVNGANIYQLHVAGTLRPGTRYYASGLVGQIQGDGTTIKNCRSSVSIEYNSGTGTCYSAGLVGNGQSYTFTIANSMFDGSIGYVEGGTGTLQNMAGILAWSAQSGHPTIINCLNAGTFQSTSISKIIRLHDSNTSAVIINCYSTTDASSNGSYYDARGTYTTATGNELAALLGNHFEMSGDVLTPKTGLTNLGTCTITGVKPYYYNDGTTHQPEPIVTDIFGTVLTKGTDYILDWNSDGTTAGIYTVTVSGRGNYSGTASANYEVTDGIPVTSAPYSTPVTWEDGYIYKVYEDANIEYRITVRGSVMLILGEGATLTAVRGISVENGRTLTIQGSGTLTANAANNNAAIGGGDSSNPAGTIIINSGIINATGYNGGAGIGGNRLRSAGTIIINSGIINATGYNGGAGIGGGGGQATNKPGAGGTIIINGGKVTATSENGFGIGYGKRDTGSVDGDAGTISLGWTERDDFIQASSFAGTVGLTEDYPFYYEGGTTGVTTDNLATHEGEKIIPCTIHIDYNLEFATIGGVASSYFYTGNAYILAPTVTDFLGNALTEGTHYNAAYTLNGEPVETIQALGDYTLTITAIDGGGYENSLTIPFTVTDNLQSDGAGGYYVNMLKTGTKQVSLVAQRSAKVYDDGGSQGNFSRNCDGYLLLTAPEGYYISLTGAIDVYTENQILTAYEGATASDATKLASYNTDGNVGVASEGNVMLLHFATNAAGTATGFNLTATAELPTYDLTASSAHGTVTFSVENAAATRARVGQTVTVTVAPANGYSTGAVTVAYTGEGNTQQAVDVTKVSDNVWTFVMPHAAPTATVAYKRILQDEWIAAIADQTYTGGNITPDLTVKDGETDLTLNTDYTAAYTSNKNVGTATVTITAVSNSGYSGTASATFAITQKEVGLTWGETAFTYTGEEHQPTATATGLMGTDECTVTVTGGETNAGDYTATATELSNENYKLPENPTTDFSIEQVALSVTALNSTIIYSDEPANNGVVYDGFVNNEDESVLEGELTYTYTEKDVYLHLPYAESMHVGEYLITPNGLTATNYAITFTTGTMTVEAKEIGLQWGETTFDADGNEHVPTATATGLVEGDECEVEIIGAQTEVGNQYYASATHLSNGNYKLPDDRDCDFDIVRDMSHVFADDCQWATYVAQENLATPEGITAYVVSEVTADEVVATQIDYIPEGVGILLERPHIGSFTYKASAHDGGDDPQSLLVGSATASTDMTAYSDYALYNGEFVLATFSSISAGKAYLPANALSADAPQRLNIRIDGEATGIRSVTLSGKEEGWYDLNGRPLRGKPTQKGIYLHDGKKVMVK